LATSPRNPNIFVDDPGKLYRQRRRATQAKGLETLDPKAEIEGSLESPRESPPPNPKEDQPQPPPMGEAQDLRAVEARSTFEECEEYGHVQGKPRFNASSSIQDLVPLCTQLKDSMEEQDKINKDVVTKFEAMEEVLENLDGKVMEVGSSIREVFIMMKMLETQVGQLVGHPMGSKGRLSGQSQVSEKAKATQTHSGEMEDHTKTTKITTEGPEFEMSSHYMKEVVAFVRTKGQSQPVKTKKMTKPKNKPVPKMVRKWVPKIATPAKSVDLK
jgi:hypothetical protein